MRIQRATQSGLCDAVIAEFVFGPTRCLKRAEFITEDDGETFFVCADHITAAGMEVPS